MSLNRFLSEPFVKACQSLSRWIQHPWIWLALVLGLFSALWCRVLRPDLLGFLYDDGMYFMTAKSLTEGHGYRLMGIVGQPVFYKYPPLYPLLLASGLMVSGWLQWPINYPWGETLLSLKALNLGLTLAALILFFLYFYRLQRWSLPISIGLLLMVATNWRLMEVSVELMSEPLYLVLSVGLLVYVGFIEQGLTALKADSLKTPIVLNPNQWVVVGALSLGCFYTRTMGLILIGAVFLWAWLRVSRRSALAYWGIMSFGILPWFAWGLTQPNQTFAVEDFLVRTFQETYFQSMRMDLRYEYNLLQLVHNGLTELIGNFSAQVFPILEWFFLEKATWFSELAVLGVSVLLLAFIGTVGYRAVQQRQFSLVGLYVALYLLVLPWWSFVKFYPRFLIVLLPFMLPMLLQGIRLLPNASEPKKQWLIRGFIVLGVVTNLIHFSPYLQQPHRNTLLINQTVDLWQEYASVLSFLNDQTPKPSSVFTENLDESYFYGLNTSHLAHDFFVFLPRETLLPGQEEDIDYLKAKMNERAEVMYQVIQKARTGYVIQNHHALVKNQYNNWRLAQTFSRPVPTMVQNHPQDFTPVFRSPAGWMTVYRLRGQ